MATKLRDLLHEQPEDLWHLYFPGKTPEDVQMEWQVFGDAFAEGFIQRVYDYLHKLEIPKTNEVSMVRPFPEGLMHHIVDMIDLHLPHWTLVQRAVLSEVMIRSIYDEAVIMWRDIVRIGNNVTEEQAEIMAQNFKHN